MLPLISCDEYAESEQDIQREYIDKNSNNENNACDDGNNIKIASLFLLTVAQSILPWNCYLGPLALIWFQLYSECGVQPLKFGKG